MRASKFLDAHKIESLEIVPASRKLGKPDAEALAKAASKVCVAKGRQVQEWKPAGKPGADLIAAMLGPTGNLRAPCLRVGKTLIVGFNEDLYSDVFG